MILTNQREWVINDVFESFFQRYLIGLETSMRGSDFISNSAQLSYYKCHKIIFKLGRSYIDSPDWIKKKKATTNQKNEDGKCSHYAAYVALNQEEIKRDPQRTPRIKPFINKYSRNRIKYS